MVSEAGFKILIVDDEEPIRRCMRDFLIKSGYEAAVAPDAMHAMECLERESFDLVFTDLNMPKMDGLQLLHAIKTRDKKINVAILTGFASTDKVVEAMKDGACEFLEKPVNLSFVLQIVGKYRDQKELSNENLALKERIAIYKVSQLLSSSHEPKEALELIMSSVANLIKADRGSLVLKEKDKYSIKTGFGLNEFMKIDQPIDIRPESVMGRVLKSGTPLLLLEDKNRSGPVGQGLSRKELRSSLCCPLKIQEKIIGIMNLSRITIPEKFSERDRTLLSIFANQAAIAIENAMLYSRLRSALQTARNERDEIKAILSSVSNGILVIDALGNIRLHNRKILEIFQLEETAIQAGAPYRDVLQDASLVLVRKFVDASLNRAEPVVDAKIDLIIGQEAKNLAVTYVPLNLGGDERQGIFVFEDLTQLIRNQNIAAWQGLARRLAHEVKNPLTPIQWAAEAVMEGDLGGEDKFEDVINKNMTVVIREVGRLNALITEFSKFAKLPQPRLESRQLNAILTHVADLYSTCPQNIQIKTDLEPDLPPILADEKMLEECFVNLVKNSLEAMDETGGEIRIASRLENNSIVATVQDQGKGIPPEELDKIFEPYVTSKETGTGLGLTVTSKIFSDHKARVNVQSEVGKGTSFIIKFPSMK